MHSSITIFSVFRVVAVWLLTLFVSFGSNRLFAEPLPVESLEGKWAGTLHDAGVDTRFEYTIRNEGRGRLYASLRGPQRGPARILVDSASYDRGALHLQVSSIGGSFQGALAGGGRTIDGSWYQNGIVLPLSLERLDETAPPPRPQEPAHPLPYRAENVLFANERAGLHLAGTLTLPDELGPHPAVLLISGSGPQDRDVTLLGHQPFRVLADYLTRRGIAVLRVDDRGVGDSGGDFALATSRDFADDALAAVHFLRQRADIDSRRIGLLGHSEGGMIATMVAEELSAIAFIVTMAAPGIPGDEILQLQGASIARLRGADEEDIATYSAVKQRIWQMLKSEDDTDDLRSGLRTMLQDAIAAIGRDDALVFGLSEASIDNRVEQISSPWFRYFVNYDPRSALRMIDCPVLALNGELDIQVPPRENLAAISRALREGGNNHYRVIELPRLNHLFQTATTGAIAEYAHIEETIAPLALDTISDWICETTTR